MPESKVKRKNSQKNVKQHVIEIADLCVDYRVADSKSVHALRHVNMSVQRGESVAIVGESGCGKSTLALSLLNLMPVNAKSKGSVRLNGQEVLNIKNRILEKIRGVKAGIIFQEPGASLNPVMTVKEQIEETILAHKPGTSAKELEINGHRLLEETGINEPGRVYKSYPHQLSGGQQQRVMTAIALSCNPDILIADEPTTALDVTVQAQIIKMLKKLKKDRGLALVLITHDLHLAMELADRIVVMYAGEIIESGKITKKNDARHPYTRALFEIIPDINAGKKDFKVIPGELPDMCVFKDMCYFTERCVRVKDKCRHTHPDIMTVKEHAFRCYYPFGK